MIVTVLGALKGEYNDSEVMKDLTCALFGISQTERESGTQHGTYHNCFLTKKHEYVMNIFGNSSIHIFSILWGLWVNWQSNSDEVRNRNLKEIIWSPNFLNSKIGCGSYKWYDIFHDSTFPTSQSYNPYKEVFRELKSEKKKKFRVYKP